MAVTSGPRVFNPLLVPATAPIRVKNLLRGASIRRARSAPSAVIESLLASKDGERFAMINPMRRKTIPVVLVETVRTIPEGAEPITVNPLFSAAMEQLFRKASEGRVNPEDLLPEFIERFIARLADDTGKDIVEVRSAYIERLTRTSSDLSLLRRIEELEGRLSEKDIRAMSKTRRSYLTAKGCGKVIVGVATLVALIASMGTLAPVIIVATGATAFVAITSGSYNLGRAIKG